MVITWCYSPRARGSSSVEPIAKASVDSWVLDCNEHRPTSHRSNPAHDVLAVPGEETSRLGMMKKRVLIAQDELDFALERRHPVRVPSIHRPGEPDEFLHPFLGGDMFDLHGYRSLTRTR